MFPPLESAAVVPLVSLSRQNIDGVPAFTEAS